MKIKNAQHLWISFFCILSFSSTPVAKADSPATSTPFYQAYEDIQLVRQAAKSQDLSEAMAAFLFDPQQALDQKLALINALGWQFEGLHNTVKYQRYLEHLHQKSIYDMQPLEITASDQLILGYLMLMDDYFHPEKSLVLLRRGARRLWQSQSAQIVLSLAESQDYLNDFEAWCQVWMISESALKGESLKQDMRPEAIAIIREYLILYRDYCSQSRESFNAPK